MEQSVAAANAEVDGFKKAFKAQTEEKFQIRISSVRATDELVNVRSYLRGSTNNLTFVDRCGK